jgi:hypothetical protein
VASKRARRLERRRRERTYQDALAIPEALYVDHDRDRLELWRLREGKYFPVAAEDGRLYSQDLGVWFGWEPGRWFVRIWTPDGRMLPTPEVQREQVTAARERARQAEARVAALEAELARLRREGP